MTARNGDGVIQVLLASTSALRRAGLEAMIRSSPALKLVGSLYGLRSILERAVELQADVALMDVDSKASLPALQQLPIVVLVDEATPGWTAQALRSGVKAILPREAGADELVSAVQAAYAGFVLLDPEITRNLAQQVRAPAARPTALDDLTAREIEVLRMLAEGLGNRRIAEVLGISDHTVKFHISSILNKLGASTRTEAVTLGIRMGLILL
jgi:two-component system, NarL family, response regulator YdfI